MNQHFLAIQGGQPAFADGPPDWPVAGDAIFKSVGHALKSGQWGLYEGELTDRLQHQLQSAFGLNHSLLCSSGTISVELALRGIGVKRGDEVVLSAYDFPGNFRSIEAVGAVPVLVDVVSGGWVIDPARVGDAVSDKTAAIIVSHLHGQTAPVRRIKEILGIHGVKIIEDVCQSPGGQFLTDQDVGRKLGALGDVATFSFGGSKLLSSGRGGAVLSHDPSVIQRAKIFAHRGNDAFPLSQIQAALLLPQLEHLQDLNRRRCCAAKQIIDAIERLPGLSSLTLRCADEAIRGFYKLPILADQASISRTQFLAAIQAEGVAMDVGFRGFAKRSQRRCRQAGSLHNAVRAAADTMLLHHPILIASDEQIHRLITTIQRCHQFCLGQG